MRSIITAACMLLCACASSTPPPAGPATSSVETTVGSVEACELVCDKPQVTMPPVASPDVTEAASANVDHVFATMHDDLLACYRTRLRTDPRAHAFMTVDLVLEPNGHVRSVETTGGATLGDSGIRCISDRIKKATFAPIPGGGTRRIQVPLTFRRLGPAETT